MPPSVLALFPTRPHALTLVSDPDDVLAEPPLRDALAGRGYRVIVAADPVRLRYDIGRARPFGADHPVLIVTPGPLNTLPYDVWQTGHHISLTLDALFPGLDPGVVRALSPQGRWRLGQAIDTGDALPRETRLSAAATRDFLLRALFDIDVRQPVSQARLVAWLDDYHHSGERLPADLAEHLVERLGRQRALVGLPLAQLLADAESYRRYVGAAWADYVHRLGEPGEPYHSDSGLRFAEDAGLQKLAPSLVASGAIPRGALPPGASAPEWAFETPSQGVSPADFRDALAWLEERLQGGVADWAAWQAIARRWADATVLRYSPDLTLTNVDWQRYKTLADGLDAAFLAWLRGSYSRLATVALPTPHHLYHVPGWLAHHYNPAAGRRVALLILDGMSLADWHLIRETWAKRHPAWPLTERLVLAQVPTITAISRQALVRGQRPAEFAADLTQSREKAGWGTFWAARDLPERSVGYTPLPTALNAAYPAAVESSYTRALCLVTPVVDNIVHGATEGAAAVFAALRVWLHQGGAEQGSPWLEALVHRLLDAGYVVALTSDHGHVEAIGGGQPAGRGLSVTRAQRVLPFDDPALAALAPVPDVATISWSGDSVLPDGLDAVMPAGRAAFAPKGARVVSHGGVALDEMIVPLVTIGDG